MLTTVATVLAGLIGAGIIVIGANLLRAPQAAVTFGIPDAPIGDRAFRAWVTVKAVRDIGAGLLILVPLAAGSAQLLGWVMLAATGMPAGDALIVLRSKGPRAVAYGVHAATAAVMLVISVLLLIA